MKTSIASIAALTTALACASAPAWSQERHDHRGQPGARAPQHLQLDQRYHHDHYYPQRGYAVGALPGGALTIGWGGGAAGTGWAAS